MQLSLVPPVPSSLSSTISTHLKVQCCTLTQPIKLDKKSMEINRPLKNWEHLLDPVYNNSTSSCSASQRPVKLGSKWMEYQGIRNWEGLLNPLDDNLRAEILRYGNFVEAAYNSFDFDPSSPAYATCRFQKSTLLERSGLPQTGYRLTKHLRATSGIQLPRWIEKAPSWVATQSSWIGYVAVCQDKEEISRLGRRDVVISYRGTATCLEWLENLRATLANIPDANSETETSGPCSCGPMVESGFLSLYTSRTAMGPSLQEMVREEIQRLLQSYGDEPLSLTITGHSLGAALAILTAYDIKTTFRSAPLVTVISFGGPRVGNRSFRQHLEKQGTKVLRIVNSDDLITKVPGFVIDGDNDNENEVIKKRDVNIAGIPGWIQKRVEETQWAYAEVGKELRLSSKDSPYINSVNVATCHELKTYLHLVNGFVSSSCPFRATAKRVLSKHRR
ncbi:triacylglycerol lipase, putative [Ricinus communis]|uniref:Triacylglycerol lipase, putative n=1 Tax=Ricinus communis TaxID=3988 RepID=B9RCZ2_RICCO|nr:triacylglycerol lipase, putative [Ricinus communis]|eukprot:XP_002511581.1 phospholipase A(1) DAD1, chloroplastic [Ricinus communis]